MDAESRLRQVKRALRASERRFRLLLESVSDPVWTTDLDMRPIEVGPAVSDLLGYSVKEAVRGSVTEALTPASLEMARHAIGQLPTADEAEPDSPDDTIRLKLEFIRKDRTPVWTDVQVSRLRDPAGRTSELLWVIQEIRERKPPEPQDERPGRVSDKDRRRAGESRPAEAALWEANRELERLYEQAHAEIAQRMRAEGELRRSLQEKEALLQEVHHRVKNNLQVICSLLNLRSESIEDPETLQVLRESQNRVRSMALIHEKLYQSQDLENVEFGSYLRDLTNHLMRSHGAESVHIQLTVAAPDIFLSIDRAVPCGLITNELVSNALKHAFPNGRDGEISVTLQPGPGENLTLSVVDNGVGLPADRDLSREDTLGLQLIRVLTNQMNGTVNLHSSEGHGTEVSITFPIS